MKQKYNNKKFTIIVLILCVFSLKLYSVDYGGSWTSEAHHVIEGGDNEILPQAIMDNGFSLLDSSVSCSYNSLFSLAGSLNLNDGRLYLRRDLMLDRNAVCGTGGKFFGNGQSVIFRRMSSSQVPLLHGGRLIEVDSYDIGADITSVDWSYDDAYLIVGSKASSNEVTILSLTGTTLSLEVNEDLGNNATSVAWHPSGYDVAIGIETATGDDLLMYNFNPSGSTFTKTDGEDLGDVYAVAWSPNGSYLAVGYTTTVAVYSFSAGSITLVDVASTSGTVYRDSISWNSTGDYFALAAGNYVQVFSFNGAQISEDANLNIGNSVYAIAFKPQSNYIAVGLDKGATQTFRVYKHALSSLTEIISARIDETQTVYALDWNSDGSFLLFGCEKNGIKELRIYWGESKEDFDYLNLFWISAEEIGYDVFSARWNHNDNFVVTGDKSDNVIAYTLGTYPFLCFDTDIVLDTTVDLTMSITFQGDCSIIGNNHMLFLGNSTYIYIAPYSTLNLVGVNVYNVLDQNIFCADNTSKIIFRDSNIFFDADFTFSTGAFEVFGDVIFNGNATFAYQSSMTSTINSNSCLHLNDGMTFKYDPEVFDTKQTTTLGRNDLMYFENSTSILCLDGGILSTNITGITLKKGKIVVHNSSYIYSEGEQGIIIGNNVSDDDFAFEFKSGAKLAIASGVLVYKNVNNDSWIMSDDNAAMDMYANTRLTLYQDLDIGNGLINFASGSSLFFEQGKNIFGRTNVLGSFYKREL